MVSKKGSKKEVTLESIDKKITSIERKINDIRKKSKDVRRFRGIHLIAFGMVFLGIGLPLLINSVDLPKDPSVIFSFIFISIGLYFSFKGLYDMEQDEYF